MVGLEKEILTLLTTDVFKGLIKAKTLQIAQLNAAMTLLIKAGIPFDIQFSPGTRRLAAGAEITIYINSTTNLRIKVPLEGGGTIFGL